MATPASRPASPPAPQTSAHPPETLEGWYALHQIFALAGPGATLGDLLEKGANSLLRRDAQAPQAPYVAPPTDQGWSIWVRLIGSPGYAMAVHLRPTIDELGKIETAVATDSRLAALRPVYSFLSVTEAGLYHLTAQLAKSAAERGGAVGDDQYRAEMAQRVAAERDTPHVQKRLYPPLPADMPYVCFYPMSKRRQPGQNWYSLSLEERSSLMYAHGLTGRRYAGRVQQIITGAIGFNVWEWGVTLFGRDPLDFKKLVTDMRFDEVSAKYADFGEFYVGRVVASPGELV